MPQRRSRIAAALAQSELATALADLRDGLEVPPFTSEALAEAASASVAAPSLDLREVPFATLDPVGSRDLDQAFHLQRAGTGFTVRYAIADVPAFVAPGGALDAVARSRGETLYAANGSLPLHPRVLSERRASLLPGVERPALVWTFSLDAEGAVGDVRLERALIRSRMQLDYAGTQRALDAGEEHPASLLPEIGRLRIEQEVRRGGASLNLPDDEVVRRDDGSYGIERRSPLPVEEWNAQLSLMAGMAAAQLMLEARIGILRVMPQPDDDAFATFRRQTTALGVPWTQGRYGDYLRALDRDDPRTLPVLEAATSLFRGAGYRAFDGELPDERTQSAIATPYAHATAPLRRLVDRWSLTIALAVSEGNPVPEWVRESLPEVPGLMQASGQRSSQLASRTFDFVEAALLAPHVGEVFTALVIRVNASGNGVVQLSEPAVTAAVALPPGATAGETVRVLLTAADVAKGHVAFATGA